MKTLCTFSTIHTSMALFKTPEKNLELFFATPVQSKPAAMELTPVHASAYEREKLRWEDKKWTMDLRTEKLCIEDKHASITLDQFESLVQEITVQQSKQVPSAVLQGLRCPICWKYGERDCMCIHCGMWKLCSGCFQAMEGNCHGCGFEDQQQILQTLWNSRNISFEEACT